ncbi:uncharacterized protein PV07_12672 [Cladophialophora immunda]|uniref:Serine/threonine-protein kinase ATG1 n=1 Tax=Cladophialophora immunda TaxID=569365 RepID=A0A0D2CEF2_9EURO|nr:uncharacterized protein PV07_12672 [Cladophialophora immunda]KIW21919.1 hypothetical protein PV07_12672 [Cladophialophora immunda]
MTMESSAHTGLGDIALLVGGIEGGSAQDFINLNEELIWTRPPPRAHDLANGWIDDEQPEPWRGQMRADIKLDGPILALSFLKLPRRTFGWHLGAMSETTHTDEKPRDILCPRNTESGISSSTCFFDYTTGPKGEFVPRMIPLLHRSFIRIQMGPFDLRQRYHQELVLTEPVKILFPTLRFWLWIPTLNKDEEKVFKSNVRDFCRRTNCLDQEYFPGIAASTGGSSLAPTPMFDRLTRIGRSGAIYKAFGKIISKGGYRTVFRVQVIKNPHFGEFQDDEDVAGPDEPMLVAKEIYQKGDGSQLAKKEFREMQENEWKTVMHNPHPNVNAIVDIAYVPETDDPPWVIEEYQPYCLGQREKLPMDVDKVEMASQLLSGLKHYHESGIMHRDVKPKNVLMRLVKCSNHGCSDDRCSDDECAGHQYRWDYKFTDNGAVRSTHRRVEGLAGTPFFCAPEVLDKKPYGAKADIFSLGVLFLEHFVGHDRSRDTPFKDTEYPKSSFQVQQWMQLVDPLIERNCDPEYRPLLRGMLLRDPLKRWSANKCLAFLNLDPSEKPEQTILIGPTLPWTTQPFTEEVKAGLKRKLAEFEHNGECGHVGPDGVESDNASTIVETCPALLMQGSGQMVSSLDNDLANLGGICEVDINSVIEGSENGTFITAPEEFLVEDAPATPKASCAAQMPNTPCQDAAGGNGLASVPCTPLADDDATRLAVGRVANQQEAYDFTDCHNEWDWGDGRQPMIRFTRTIAQSYRHNRYPPPWASRVSQYTNVATTCPPKKESAGVLTLGIYDFDKVMRNPIASQRETKPLISPPVQTRDNRLNTSRSPQPPPDAEHGDTSASRPLEPAAENARQLSPSQQRTKTTRQVILSAEGGLPTTAKVSDSKAQESPLPDAMLPKDCVPPEASLVNEADTEVVTRVDDGGRHLEGSPASGRRTDSEAPTDLDCEERQPEAPPVSGSRANTKALPEIDHGDTELNVLDGRFGPLLPIPDARKRQQHAITRMEGANTMRTTRHTRNAFGNKGFNWDMGFGGQGMGVIR